MVDIEGTIVGLEKTIAEKREAKEAKLAKIENLSSEVKQDDAEIADLHNKINVVKSLWGGGVSGAKSTAPLVATAPADGTVDSYVLNILNSEPEREFTAGDVTKLVLARGYQTSSASFEDVVRNGLIRLDKSETVKSRKVGRNRRVYYSINRKDFSGVDLYADIEK